MTDAFAAFEYRHLKRTLSRIERSQRGLGFLLLVLALAACIAPLIYDMNTANRPILLVALAILYVFSLYIEFFAVLLPIYSGWSDSEMGDLLALTHVTARQLVIHRWRGAVRLLWRVFLFVGVFRLVAAYVWMRYFWRYPLHLPYALTSTRYIHLILRPFYYTSQYTSLVCDANGENCLWVTNQSGNYQWMIAAAVIILLSGVQLATFAAVGTLASFYCAGKPIKLAVMQLLRVILSAFVLAAIVTVNYKWMPRPGSGALGPFIGFRLGPLSTRDYLRLVETLQISGLSLIDGGILLSSTFLRPKGSVLYLLRMSVAAGLSICVHLVATIGALAVAGRVVRR